MLFPNIYFFHVIKPSTCVFLASNSGHYKGVPRFVFTAKEKKMGLINLNTRQAGKSRVAQKVNHRNGEAGATSASGNVILAFSKIQN